MKSVLLIALLLFSNLFARSQVHSLPSGKYETVLKEKNTKWDLGDIVILDDSKYRISSTDEIGEFKFSAIAQRIFFTSGPLKSVFAKTTLNGDKPAIILPVNENEQQGTRLASSDVWGYYKQ